MPTLLSRAHRSAPFPMCAAVCAVLLTTACGPAEFEEGEETEAAVAALSTTFPAKFDMYTSMTPVKDQGSRNLGTIFATAGLMEMLHKKAGMSNPDFSEQYLQWSVKVQVGAMPNTEASSVYYNLQAINRYGIPVESAWPYESQPWTTANDPRCNGSASAPTSCYTNGEPPAAAKAARKYKLPVSRWVATNNIKDVLFNQKLPVAVDLDVFRQAWNDSHSTLPINQNYLNKGFVLSPNQADITAAGQSPNRHGVVLMGWNDDLKVQKVDAKGALVVDASGKPVYEQGFYLFKNSRGTSKFGANNSIAAGYGWISYSYINAYASAYTADPPVLTP